MAAACALAIFSGKLFLYLQFWKICGFSRIAFSREGSQREMADTMGNKRLPLQTYKIVLYFILSTMTGAWR